MSVLFCFTDKYDGLARNPLYCSADRGVETELSTLASHYHPSVVVFAQHILNSEPIVYSGDPMSDFSLQKFLDRFVFRNPKKITKTGMKSCTMLYPQLNL